MHALGFHMFSNSPTQSSIVSFWPNFHQLALCWFVRKPNDNSQMLEQQIDVHVLQQQMYNQAYLSAAHTEKCWCYA
jgi:hypothetical protein